MFMMEVNMMNPEHTAPHATYTINLFMIAFYGIRAHCGSTRHDIY